MRRCLRAHGSAFVLALLLGLVITGCDSDKPTEPGPVADYPVYFWDAASNHKLFVYHPTTKEIDSLDFPYAPVNGMTASADGKLLYLSVSNAVEVVETDSFTLVTTLPYHSRDAVAVSPDDSLLAIMGDSLRILRTSDYSVAFLDTSRVWEGVFSDDCKTLYCAAQSGSYIYTVRFLAADTVVSRKRLAGAGFLQAVPTLDESVMLLYLNSGNFDYWFWAYDPIGDTAVFEEFLYPGGGRIARTHDGTKAFYTNPGRMIGPMGSSSFKVFDLLTNTVDHVVETNNFINDSTPVFVEPGYMAITPDDRWLVALNSVAPHQIVTYDIVNDRMVDWHVLGHDKWFTNITVQSKR